jgi:sporulation protein YlmC with PRC-barrel domain
MLGQVRLSPARDFEGAAAGWARQGPRKTRGAAQMMPFRIGADASCTDGACGQVSRIIVNPVTREVTHLAVDPKHRSGPGRLVPADLVDATTGQIRLGCTLAEFQTLRPAQETEAVPDLDPTGHGHPGVQKPLHLGGGEVWVPPEARKLEAPQTLHLGGGEVWVPPDTGEPEAPPQVTVDSVPSGAVEVHRGLIVCAIDGEIGQVQGLVVEPGARQVTHVLLQKGHMRGRKDVAIPIGAVTKIGTLLIHLSLTKHQVKDLPPVNID